MRLQEWIHHFEVGAGSRLLKFIAAILAFFAIGCLYDVLDWQSFSSEEAMDTAQLARNISQGRGFVTDSIRPLSVYFLQKRSGPGESANVLRHPVPDLSTPPVYPLVLAAAMKVLPLHFNDAQWWNYQPEHCIAVFNQFLFLLSIFVLFQTARGLFDTRVAWLSAVLFGGTNLFWRFSISGLSTSWVVLVFLVLVWCLLRVEAAARVPSARAAPLGFAFVAGLVLGLGGLSLYSFAWLIFPVLAYLVVSAPGGRGRVCLSLIAGFLLVMLPWVVRNVNLTGMPFGERTLCLVQGTDAFPDDTLERSFNPQPSLQRVGQRELVNKALANGREEWHDSLPRLGGNWISAFFLVGLFIPFQTPVRWRLRWFLLGCLFCFFIVQALGETHVSRELNAVNTENLLVIVFPLVVVFGAALFYTLLDQMDWATPDLRGSFVGGFGILLCAPLLITLLLGQTVAPYSPYSPLQIRRTARLFTRDELMTSDIPSGVAWYGGRACAWLPLNDDRDYYLLNSLKPVKGLYLTQRTTNQRLLEEMLLAPKSWAYFAYQVESKGEVPDNFPLTKAPLGFLPYQLLLSDQARWRQLTPLHESSSR